MVSYAEFCKFTLKETCTFYYAVASTWKWISKFDNQLPFDFVAVILETINSYSIIISDMNKAVQRRTVPNYMHGFNDAKYAIAANLNKLQCLWALLTQFHKHMTI